MAAPQITEDKMYRLVRDEKLVTFNKLKAQGAEIDFEGCDFRGLDLRKMDVSGISFKNAYFRQTDLRGLDFSKCNFEGASICNAKISGSYFPQRLPAEEITLSLAHGTRMRYRRVPKSS
ncbi:MAG: pentapeptide repeat-containing protein [Methylococcales bacterium]|jgi:uncharacterized protein YjbI with pentapeptide repeats|nr:pentapeptide repeat-containing protein [Methylococcales bacterium]MBT7444686.1 pentapeptide repeat-containing protein [Methylococcales bacterium]